MNYIVRIMICALPSLIAFLCACSVMSKWGQRNRAQRTMGAMMLVTCLASLYFFVFQMDILRRAHRLDWVLTSLMAFVPACYYLFIRRLTGAGRRSTLFRTFLIPSVLVFLSLVLYMMMGDKSAGDYLEQVKFAWPVPFSSIPVLWKVAYVYHAYLFKLAFLYQIVIFIMATYGRITRFHSELKDYYADAETRLFPSGTTLGVSGIVFLFGLLMLNFGPYYLYEVDFYYVVVSVTLVVASMLYLTAYTLHQPITADALTIMEEETKNMGQAVKNNSSLKGRLAAAVEDGFYLNPDVTIMDLAEMIGTNRAYISDIIHVTYGTSFADFINDLRVKRAIKEMRQIPLNTPLTKVANMCGYPTYSQFAHNFEKFAHLTPTEWMKRYR